MAKVITIPKGDFVLIPRKEYEELAVLRKFIPVAKPTKEELRIIRRGEKEIREGKYVEWRTINKRTLARRRN